MQEFWIGVLASMPGCALAMYFGYKFGKGDW